MAESTPKTGMSCLSVALNLLLLRNFRLYMSSKASKKTYLTPVPTSAWLKFLLESADSRLSPSELCAGMEEPSLPLEHVDLHRKLFMESLVCNVPFSGELKLLGLGPQGFQRLRGSALAAGDCATDTAELDSRERHGDVANETRYSTGPKQLVQSPYPQIDSHILSTCTQPGLPTTPAIRRCLYFEEGKTILYDITGYRYCGNVGRHHKSNGDANLSVSIINSVQGYLWL